MEEGQAFIEHSDGLVLLQLQRLLEILHGCHIILKDNERKEGISTYDKIWRNEYNIFQKFGVLRNVQ